MFWTLLSSSSSQPSWGNPQDVKDFLLWLIAPGGFVASLVALWLYSRVGNRVNAVSNDVKNVSNDVKDAKVDAARAQGTADALTQVTTGLQNQNTEQGKQLNDINRALPPKS